MIDNILVQVIFFHIIECDGNMSHYEYYVAKIENRFFCHSYIAQLYCNNEVVLYFVIYGHNRGHYYYEIIDFFIIAIHNIMYICFVVKASED